LLLVLVLLLAVLEWSNERGWKAGVSGLSEDDGECKFEVLLVALAW
jgi:ribosome modulation factor